MIVSLPDGQELEFPDDTSQDVMRDAIYKNFPQYKTQKEESENQDPRNGSLRYGVQDPLIGIAKLRHGLINAPHNLAALFSRELADKIPKQDDFDYSSAFGIPESNKNNIDKLIQFLPEMFVSTVLPETKLGEIGKVISSIPKAGKYLKTAIGNSLTQSGFAASQSDENQGESAIHAAEVAGPFAALSKASISGSPALRFISRLLMGSGGAYLGHEGAKSLGASDNASDFAGALLGIGGYRGFTPKRHAAQDILKGVEGTNYKEFLNAADRLGLDYVTPAEASGNPFTGAAQGSVGKTEKGAELLYSAGQKRATSEKNSINNLLDTVFNVSDKSPTSDTKTISRLYKETGDSRVTKNFIHELNENEIYQAAKKRVESVPAYRQALKGAQEDSFTYLDQVKRALGDMSESAKVQGSPTNESRLIKSFEKGFVKKLDKINPDYATARALSERKIARDKIEGSLNKSQYTGSNFYNKILSNDKKFNKLKYSLRNVPEAQRKLDDMRMVFGRLINTPTAKTAEALSRTSMSKDRATYGAISHKVKEILSGGRYDKAAVELITNPKWNEELSKLNKVTNSEKLASELYKLLGRAGAQGVAQ